MKNNNLIFGVLLVVVGALLLLYNLNLLDLQFSFRSVFKLWPLWLVYGGVSLLWSRNPRYSGLVGIIGLLLIAFVLLVGFLPQIIGASHRKPSASIDWLHDRLYNNNDNDQNNIDSDNEDSDTQTYSQKEFIFNEPLKPQTTAAQLNIEVGAGDFEITGGTASLINMDAKTQLDYKFSPVYNADNTQATISIASKGNINLGKDLNTVKTQLNTTPMWEIKAEMGACKMNFDLTKHKIKKFNLEAGAADVDVTFGDLLPELNAKFEMGASDLKIRIPKSVGCQITTETALSSQDFKGFEKKGDQYFSPNFNSSNKKIFIAIESGISNLDVELY
jgi:hypothetical protein